jgi:hypothetical protein
MGVFFNEDYTQGDIRSQVKAAARWGAKEAVRRGVISKEDQKSARHAGYKMGLDINKRLMDKTGGKSLDRYNKADRLRSDRNRAKFFAHEDYSEDQAHDHKFGFDDSEGLYNADDYGHDEDDFAIDPGHSEKNDVYKDNAAAKLPGVLAASTAGGVTADDAADLQEEYTQADVKSHIKALSRWGAKEAVRRGVIPKEDQKSARHAAYKMGLERNKRFMDKTGGKLLDRVNKYNDSKSARNRAKFFSNN